MLSEGLENNFPWCYINPATNFKKESKQWTTRDWRFVMKKTWILFELQQLLYAFSQQTLVTSWRTVLLLRGTHVLSEAALFALTLDNGFWFCCALSFKGGSCPDEQWAAARARVTRPVSSPVFIVTLLSFFIAAKILSSRKKNNLGVSILQQKDRITRKQSIWNNTSVYCFSSHATFCTGSATSHQENKLHFKLPSTLFKFSNFLMDQVHDFNAECEIKFVGCWLLEIKHAIGTLWVSSKLFEWSKFNLA